MLGLEYEPKGLKKTVLLFKYLRYSPDNYSVFSIDNVNDNRDKIYSMSSCSHVPKRKPNIKC